MSTFLSQSLANKLQNDPIFNVAEEPIAPVQYGGFVNQGRYMRGRGGTQRLPNAKVFMTSEKAGVVTFLVIQITDGRTRLQMQDKN